MEKKTDYTLGVGIGLVLCALVLLIFPKLTGLDGFVAWVFYVVGLILLCVSILSTCAEAFKR